MIIAECKRASPSRGMLAETYDPEALALAYGRGGAGMISVITEPRFFLGAASHLETVRRAVSLPILRQGFHRRSLPDPRCLGFSAPMPSSSSRPSSTAPPSRNSAACAREHSLSVLVEVRDGSEIERALECAPDAVGVNMRDLRDFSEDGALRREARARELRALLPAGIVAVAESGLKTPGEAVQLFRLGFKAFLIGETFVRARDPEGEVRAFVDALC